MIRGGRAVVDAVLPMVTLPGVYRPRPDSWLLAQALSAEGLLAGASVLDLCAGSGVLAVVAAREGATVTAVDVSRRALLCTRINAWRHRVVVRTRRGDLFDGVPPGELFDAIVSNPPYVPAATDELPRRGAARAWDAGRDGRALLDRVCADARSHLRPGGVLLLVHSSVCDVAATAAALENQGLTVDIVGCRTAAMGPIMRARASAMWQTGLLSHGELSHHTVVVRAQLRATTRDRVESQPVAPTTAAAAARPAIGATPDVF